MKLKRLEIQQMLREMNIKFDADETYDALKQRLQQENHRRWLKSVSKSRSADVETEKSGLRIRKKAVAPQDSATGPPSDSAKPQPSKKPSALTAPAVPRVPEPSHKSRPIEKPAPGKPWKAAADGTEPFNRKKKVFDSVLRRAKRCCEWCGSKADESGGDNRLQPYHILAMLQGGEHSIKNVVALCPACRVAIENNPDPKLIKALKRKTRSRLYDPLQVLRKKPACRRRPFSKHRK